MYDRKPEKKSLTELAREHGFPEPDEKEAQRRIDAITGKPFEEDVMGREPPDPIREAAEKIHAMYRRGWRSIKHSEKEMITFSESILRDLVKRERERCLKPFIEYTMVCSKITAHDIGVFVRRIRQGGK